MYNYRIIYSWVYSHLSSSSDLFALLLISILNFSVFLFYFFFHKKHSCDLHHAIVEAWWHLWWKMLCVLTLWDLLLSLLLSLLMLLEIFNVVYEQHIKYEIRACVASESEDRNFASGAVFMLGLPMPLSLTPSSLSIFRGIWEVRHVLMSLVTIVRQLIGCDETGQINKPFWLTTARHPLWINREIWLNWTTGLSFSLFLVVRFISAAGAILLHRAFTSNLLICDHASSNTGFALLCRQAKRYFLKTMMSLHRHRLMARRTRSKQACNHQ